jgi:hypothetical protein
MIAKRWYGIGLLLCAGCCLIVQASCVDDPREHTDIDYWVVVEGTVRDSASSSPIPGALIYDTYSGSEGPPNARTDSVGHYHLRIYGRILRGTIEIRATGYQSRSYDLVSSADSLGPMNYQLDAYLRRR